MPEPAFIAAPDLTRRPPRSLRCRLGGYVILPRMLDKGRATLLGKNGAFIYNASFDQHLVNFLGFDADALLKELATGAGDSEILEWLKRNAERQPSRWEIEQWSDYQVRRSPDSDARTLFFFYGSVGRLSRTREDIRSWMDLIDLDDFVTFGGKA
ncbi:MAG TPA: DUF5069 domain-containing protein [Chthoniobacterales bacterium]|jgi:hypothetical protein|nr:DUF5069 domain-containing protein [Chthoniobacterales bacterium]